MLSIWRNCNVATLAGDDWGYIENAAIITRHANITWVGAIETLPATYLKTPFAAEHDLQGALLTPGLIDCHTHLVYAGSRAHEAELRRTGASYAEIAKAGGGILSTVTATRNASEEELLQLAITRAKKLMNEGVTTIEVKSGYGLNLVTEERCLKVARQLAQKLPVSISTSYLAAHALAPEYNQQSDAYIDAVCAWMCILHKQNLIDAVDAFCENIGFSLEQTRKVFAQAKALMLPVKLHAEQLSNLGGTRLAASYGALSCDHLEYLDTSGISAMQQSATCAVLLPGAFYFLGETKLPPVQALREAKIPMAVASDHNPGSSPCFSLLLMAHMACYSFGLTALEAVQGISKHAAKALGLIDRGVLAIGKRADFAVWDLEHPRELIYSFGANPCISSFYAGITRKF